MRVRNFEFVPAYQGIKILRIKNGIEGIRVRLAASVSAEVPELTAVSKGSGDNQSIHAEGTTVGC
jgi:hypothetical protein